MDLDLLQEKLASPALKAIIAHWKLARGGKAMPDWSQLRPSGMARQLNIVWIYKYNPQTRQFTGRLAGNRITEGFGKNFRGTKLEDLHSPQDLPRVYRQMLRVVETPAAYKCSGTLFRKGPVRGVGERIMLPLGSGAADGVIGATDYELAPDTGTGGAIQILGNDITWFSITR